MAQIRMMKFRLKHFLPKKNLIKRHSGCSNSKANIQIWKNLRRKKTLLKIILIATSGIPGIDKAIGSEFFGSIQISVAWI